MKAIRVHRAGPPSELRLEEVPVPEPGAGEVLVQVHAAGVNPPDWYGRGGLSAIPEELRPVLTFPFTPGSDVSGTVVALGPGVTTWAEGDEVFGLLRFPTTIGGARGYAEYTTAPVTDLARKPAALDHDHAAAVPMAGLTAYQYLVDHAKPEPGSTVLVNGAAGGVGHFLVQLVRHRGARVIAVASGRHEDFLRGLGVDEYVDYTTTAVTDVARDVDYLFDTVGGPHGHRLTPALRDGGVLSPVFFGDYHDHELAARGIQRASGQVHSDGRQLGELAELIDSGAVRVHLDSTFPLTEAWRAHERGERGHLQGKIVLRVAGAGPRP
ncbi:NADP-dependent oxidoreductase [Frankia sp. CNm7]|uniref:NADP-dependent oxidoreductase n=1 Tax=Frankia nepalensis TaxID=1836974 RepID=A0A937RLZ9_9ACTN|nr:NADP-dependent oxidoreductase [Frankia nepalensis]MBL7502315.1 NADP-dependent oxidoreductase [Frankia nepalensis]MBL7514404.1 NADP-dependent oxidoreductase [Frankia nepalensis]MBL7518853.1 NADP-dependent oxidoreductase [Frankia nepalensis]MBL7632572.1 NADP-dependent oxidoreductase [Frankia nepalensis]